MTRRTPLHDTHVALGATLIDFAGWQMPVRYGSDLAEHHAVRQRAGIFDLSHMGEIEVSGDGAAGALDHALVGRMSALEPGRARYSLLCAPDGGILDDLIVYRRDPSRYLVVANAANNARVLDELVVRAGGFDAAVTDRGEQTALIALQGPAAAGVLSRLGVGDLDTLRYYAARDVRVGDVEVLLARTGYTGEDGFELFADVEAAATLWATLAEAGTDEGVVPCGLACRDTLRLEAGMPLYGNELSEQRTPFEAGLARVVKLDDDRAFVGRDALEARAGHEPAETLVGLAGSGRRAPRHGNPVLDPAGVDVGEVTSGALSPTLGIPIAMAYVATEHAVIGGALQVDVRGRMLDVEVVDPPFYRRPA